MEASTDSVKHAVQHRNPLPDLPLIEAGIPDQEPRPGRRPEVIRCHGVQSDTVSPTLRGDRWDLRAVVVPQPHHRVHARAGPDNLDAVSQVLLAGLEQGLPSRGVQPAAAAEVPLEVTSDEEIGQHLLFERRRVGSR